MRSTRLEPVFVDTMPPELGTGELYVSMIYATTVHLCACGCGNKVVLPLGPAEWQLTYDGESVSLTPSVGNWEFPCRSHYWIRSNAIRWAAPWTSEQVEAGRRRDAAALDTYHRARNRGNERQPEATQHVGGDRGLGIVRSIRRWLKRDSSMPIDSQ